MARVTVEDCLKQSNNRFHLIIHATAKAKEITKYGEAKINMKNDKPTVVALREIAKGL